MNIYNIFILFNKFRPNLNLCTNSISILFNNTIFNKYPILKIISFIILINLIYRTFVYFIFIILKSLFPIFQMYYILKNMDSYSDDKPLTKLFNKIKENNNNKENIIETLENQMNKQLGIVKYQDSNIDQV